MTIYYNEEEIITKIEIKKIKKEENNVPKKNNLNINLNFLNLGKKENEEENNDENIKKHECKNIFDFCNYFPSLTSDIITNYFNYQEEINLNSFLEEYFAIINENIMNEEMFNDYNEIEKKNIQTQIENYIHAQIYNKIFNNIADDTDNRAFKNCEKYNWVRPQNINPELKYVDDKMVQIMIYFVNNMMNEKCPANKIKEFEKIDMIINNIILLYGFDTKFYNDLMMYVFIKAKPNLINSIFRYLKMYLDAHLLDKYCSLLKRIEQLIKNISNINDNCVIVDEKDEKNN